MNNVIQFPAQPDRRNTGLKQRLVEELGEFDPGDPRDRRRFIEHARLAARKDIEKI